jgi:hypothetical protein
MITIKTDKVIKPGLIFTLNTSVNKSKHVIRAKRPTYREAVHAMNNRQQDAISFRLIPV